MNSELIHSIPATSITPLLTRKRTAGGEEKIHERLPCSLISTEDEVNIAKMDNDGRIDLSTVANRSYLTNLPSHLRTHLGTFLSINDISAMTQTNQLLYSERFNHSYGLKKSRVFHLVLEERLPPVDDFKRTLQPFRFLFQSQNYGTLQVDFALVNPPTASSPPVFFNTRRRSPVPKPPWEEAFVRINIQKKFPGGTSPALSTPKVIFRIDQSLPGCCFHFESKYVVGWGAGHLASLLQKCVLRLTHLQKEVGEGEVVEYKPSPEYILTKVQATLRDNMLRNVIKKDDRELRKSIEWMPFTIQPTSYIS
jgi:hypothetical protein